MTDALKKSVAEIGQFNKNEEALLGLALTKRSLAKNEVFLQMGEVSNEIAFVEKGSLRAFLTNNDNEENTTQLYLPEDWVMNYSSFSSRKPSKVQINAHKECILYTLNLEAIHFLIGQSQSFLQLGRLSTPKDHENTSLQAGLSPKEKYLQLIARKPQLLQEFPLKWIASYLNMTPETLSRVRAKLTQQ